MDQGNRQIAKRGEGLMGMRRAGGRVVFAEDGIVWSGAGARHVPGARPFSSQVILTTRAPCLLVLRVGVDSSPSAVRPKEEP